MYLGGSRTLTCGRVCAVILWGFVAVFTYTQQGFDNGGLLLVVLTGLGLSFFLMLCAQDTLFTGDGGGRLEATSDTYYLLVILCRTAGLVCTSALLTTCPSTGPSVVSGLQLFTRLVILEGLLVSVLGYGTV
jgi:hypothetical protein